MNALYKGLCVALVSALMLIAPSAWADAGHDHGESAPTASGPAAPRFSAVSDDFELVGVLEGHQLKLYLDDAPTNRPVEGATLELQANGSALPVTALGAGEFVADWDNAPESGEVAFTALITAGAHSDLLVAELDIHHEEEQAAAHAEGFGPLITGLLPWVLGGLGLLLGLMGFINSLRNRPQREVKP